MDTIDARMHSVESAALEYVQVWKALRHELITDDERKILEDRRAIWEAELRAAVDALVKT